MDIAVLVRAERIPNVGISASEDSAEWISIALMQNRKRRRTNDPDDTNFSVCDPLDRPHGNGMEMV